MRALLRYCIITGVLLVVSIGTAAADDARLQTVLGDEFLQVVRDAPADSIFDLLVSLGEQDSEILRMAKSAKGRLDRYNAVSGHLRAKAARRHAALPGSARATVEKQYWIANLSRVTAGREGILELAQRPGVTRIHPNARVELIEPVSAGEGNEEGTADAAGMQANLSVIGTRSAWSAGITGKGRLIASIDTGVEGVHPALRESWRGRDGDTAAAWFDPLNGTYPTDNNGHGTHVMGVMVGRAGADTIGIAPDAEWITAAVIDRGRSLGTTIADIIDALEWAADPDGNPATTDDVPDVVCNSWGVTQKIINPCDEVFFQAIENVEALGIVCVFAAGNEGPNSMTMRNPADRAVTPTSSFSVGAVDPSVNGWPVPSFSSRGPSACQGAIKPEVAAPGVAIRSSYKGGTYRTMNGTSMAAPHVAATVALLRQYNPDLTPEAIKQIILQTAQDIGAPGEDNESGRGLLNIEAALAAAAPPATPQVTIAGRAVDLTGDAIAAPGEITGIVVTLNGANAAASNLVGQLTALTPGITLLDPVTHFGTLPVGGSVSNAGDPFTFIVPDDFPVGDSIRFELSLSGDPDLEPWIQTIGLACGLPDGAMIASISTAEMTLGFSNFGHLGLGPDACLNAGGAGWRRNDSGPNLLYEASLIVGNSEGILVDAGRSIDGVNFGFAPKQPVSVFTSAQGVTTAGAQCDDSRATAPLGVEIEQSIQTYAEPEFQKFVVVEWNVKNTSAATLNGLRIGLLFDIDPATPGADDEFMVIDPALQGVYQHSVEESAAMGIIVLSGTLSGVTPFENTPGGKHVPSAGEKLNAMNAGWAESPSESADHFAILSFAPSNLSPSATSRLALAFILADSPEDFAVIAADARRRYAGYTDVGDGGGNGALLPRGHLEQNFPNPFNAETVISYSIPRDGHVRLEVFNLLGQSVAPLVDGWNPSGPHTVRWDGNDRSGRPAASGVYFYRLTSGAGVHTRKMVLLR